MRVAEDHLLRIPVCSELSSTVGSSIPPRSFPVRWLSSLRKGNWLSRSELQLSPVSSTLVWNSSSPKYQYLYRHPSLAISSTGHPALLAPGKLWWRSPLYSKESSASPSSSSSLLHPHGDGGVEDVERESPRSQDSVQCPIREVGSGELRGSVA